MYKFKYLLAFVVLLSSTGLLNAQISITTGGGDAVFNINATEPTIIDPELIITGDVDIDAASVMITDGFLTDEDLLIYPQELYGVTGDYDSYTGVLSLTGTATTAQYQEILRTIQYDNTNPEPAEVSRGITFSLGSALPFYPCDQDAPHFYEYIEENATDWYAAKSAAENQSYFGLQGYLATIMCEDENNFIIEKLNASAFIGASDDPSACPSCSGIEDWKWFWVSGPEKGTWFWHNNDPQPYYNNWFPGNTEYPSEEPNNSDGEEHYAVIYGTLTPPWGETGFWNDVRRYPNPEGSQWDDMVRGYVVEFGGMPDDPEIAISDTKVVQITEFNGVAGPISEENFVCAGTSETYNIEPVTGATDYVWEYNGDGVSITNNGTQATLSFSENASSGVLIVTPFQNDAAGGSSPDFAITVGFPPVLDENISGQTEVCIPDNNIEYSVPEVPDATNYTWSYSGTGVNITDNGTDASLSFSENATEGSLTVYCSNTCGNSEQSPELQISYKYPPVLSENISGPSEICIPEDGINYSVPEIADATSYTWNYSGNGADISNNGTLASIEFSENATSGNLTVYCSNECGDSESSQAFSINAYGFSLQNIEATGESVQTGQSGEISLEDSENGLEYQFFPEGEDTPAAEETGTGSSLLAEIATTYLEAEGNIFEVYAVNHDCKMYLDTAIIIVLKPEVEIPDGFSPNGSGFNDVFAITGITEYPDNSVQIFNRWGMLVYEANGYDNNTIVWDGKPQNNLTLGDGVLPEGTYFYIVKLGNGSEPLQGAIYLKR